jgi:predicted permease
MPFRLPWRTRQMIEDEVDVEFRTHLDERVDDLVAGGAAPDAARRQALDEFGDLERARRFCRDQDQRHERAARWRDRLADWAMDLLQAARGLARNPGYAAVAGGTLALGIAGATVIFSVVHGVLLRPLPYPMQERVITLWQRDAATGDRERVSAANAFDWRARSTTLEHVAVAEPSSFDLFGQGPPVALEAWLISQGFLEALGVTPVLGTGFVPEHFQPGAGQVVLLGHGTWERVFGADTALIGRTITLGNTARVVVGVLPADLQYPSVVDVWAPRAFTPADEQARPQNYLHGVARLSGGVTLEQARQDLGRISRELSTEHPRFNAGVTAEAVPIMEAVTGGVRDQMWVLLGAVLLLLLVASANVVNLAFARATGRRREVALRAALGAGRARLVRQVLAENLVLMTGGALLGFAIAVVGVDLMVRWAPAELPRAAEISLNAAVMAFGVVVTLVAAALCAVAPAVLAARTTVASVLREGGAGATGGTGGLRLRHGLVALEVATAVVLLVGAGLLGRSFMALLRQDLGFETENRLAFTLHVWDKFPTAVQRVQFFRDAVDRLGGVPGVQAVAAGSALPLSRNGSRIDRPALIDGGVLPNGEAPNVTLTYVTPEYFGALAIPLESGRPFRRGDAAPVAVISAEAARRFWPDRNPLGRHIALRGAPTQFEVIGVVRDVRRDGLDDAVSAELYLSNDQIGFGSMTFVVHTGQTAQRLIPTVQRELTLLEPRLVIGGLESFDALLGGTIAGRRYVLGILGGFSGFALLLAMVGIYGVLSYAVSLRTAEVGVRMALGASRGAVVSMILGQGLRVVATGLVLGLGGALLLQRFVASLLFGVAPTDPVTYLGLSAVIVVGALIAAYLPARRAAGVDPVRSIRAL